MSSCCHACQHGKIVWVGVTHNVCVTGLQQKKHTTAPLKTNKENKKTSVVVLVRIVTFNEKNSQKISYREYGIQSVVVFIDLLLVINGKVTGKEGREVSSSSHSPLSSSNNSACTSEIEQVRSKGMNV